MEIDDLWNKCVDETNDVVQCIRLFSLKIKQEVFDDIDGLCFINEFPRRVIVGDLHAYQNIKKRHLKLPS